MIALRRIYRREILAEEGYPLGLVWRDVEELVVDDVPDAPGVLVTGLSDGSVRSVVAAISLRLRFSASRNPDGLRIALIETGDYQSARWLARRLREEAGLRE